MTENNNNKQNIAIARLEEKFNSFEKRFDRFINNDFHSLKQRVDWILWILILGFLTTIILRYIQ